MSILLEPELIKSFARRILIVIIAMDTILLAKIIKRKTKLKAKLSLKTLLIHQKLLTTVDCMIFSKNKI